MSNRARIRDRLQAERDMPVIDRPYPPLSRRQRALALVYTFGFFCAVFAAIIMLRLAIFLPPFRH